MLRVKEGDLIAFQELVEAHQFRVVSAVVRMIGDDREAEDIAQQVFVRVWNSAARYERSARFTTWLFTITRNLVLNEVRRRKRHPAVSLEPQDDETPAVQPVDHATVTPDNALLDREMQEAIDAAIQALPEQQRMAIVLRRYEEMPYEDIGEVLGLSVPAVKSLLFRARNELKERLKRYLES